MGESDEQVSGQVEDMVISLPKKEDETMNSCQEPTASGSTMLADSTDPEQKTISVDEYNQEYKKLNAYIDEVFDDLERNYKNAFAAIETQFNEIFDKINQFEENLKEVLSATGNGNNALVSNANN